MNLPLLLLLSLILPLPLTLLLPLTLTYGWACPLRLEKLSSAQYPSNVSGYALPLHNVLIVPFEF